MKFWFLPLIFLFSFRSFASLECEKKKHAPLCPNTGNTILDDTYPTQSFVISMQGYRTGPTLNEPHEKMPSQFIATIIDSYKEEDLAPSIMVPCSEDEFKTLKVAVEVELTAKGYSKAYIDERLLSMKQIEGQAYTWQQDYFESFIDPQTGNPVVRNVTSYQKIAGSDSNKTKDQILNGFAQKSEKCSIEVGEPLKDFLRVRNPQDEQETSWGHGEMGGNIEGLPGGLCLVGNNLARDFTKQFCGDEKNAVSIDVGWMQVGHVDEVVKIVPGKFTDGRPQECNFSLWAASPRAGMNLLKKPENKNKMFLDRVQPKVDPNNPYAVDARVNDITEADAGKQMCALYDNHIKLNKMNPPDKSNELAPEGTKVKTGYLDKLLQHFFISQALAQVNERDYLCKYQLHNISNEEMVKAMEQDEEFTKYNLLVQEVMDKNTALIKKRVLEQLPQCGKYFSVVDVPDLFYGGKVAVVNGKEVLASPGGGLSLFPNPTNSVLANKTLMIPQAPNSLFDEEMSRLAKLQGLSSASIDTWNYAHRGQGNMHCSSHSIPYCKPRKK